MTSLDKGANSLVGSEQEREKESHGLVWYHAIKIFVLNRPPSHRFVCLLIEPLLGPWKFLVYLRRRLLAKSFIVPNLKRIMNASIDPCFPAGPSKQVFPRFEPPVFSIEIWVLFRFILLIHLFLLLVHSSSLFLKFIEVWQRIVVFWIWVGSVLSVPSVGTEARAFLKSKGICIVVGLKIVLFLLCVSASPLCLFLGVSVSICSIALVLFGRWLPTSLLGFVEVFGVIVRRFGVPRTALGRSPVILCIISIKACVVPIEIILGLKVSVEVSRALPLLSSSSLLSGWSKWIISSCVRALCVPITVVRTLSSLLSWVLSFCPQRIVLFLTVFILQYFVCIIHTFEFLLCLSSISPFLLVRMVLLSQLVVSHFDLFLLSRWLNSKDLVVVVLCVVWDSVERRKIPVGYRLKSRLLTNTSMLQ